VTNAESATAAAGNANTAVVTSGTASNAAKKFNRRAIAIPEPSDEEIAEAERQEEAEEAELDEEDEEEAKSSSGSAASSVNKRPAKRYVSSRILGRSTPAAWI
jgi:uncharacterized membrane protein YdbT with pleckstrin-like domain